jgi:hypothetical protein
MRTLLPVCLIAVLAAALSACTKEPPGQAPAPSAAPAQSAAPAPSPVATYGRVTDGPTVTPAQVLGQIDAYEGKPVRVEGTVAAVCQMRGCWMDVAGAGGEKIRIKVKDGEVVFPKDAAGKKVIAEGVVVKIPADPAVDTASCGGGSEGHAHAEGEGAGEGGEHHDCARPAGASARIDGVGATISGS